MDEKEKDENLDLLDILLDEENEEPIVLSDENGKEVSFEQIAVIPHNVNGEDKLYCILKPIDKIENVADDEAIVFEIIANVEESEIKVEENLDIAEEVFQKYTDLLEE